MHKIVSLRARGLIGTAALALLAASAAVVSPVARANNVIVLNSAEATLSLTRTTDILR